MKVILHVKISTIADSPIVTRKPHAKTTAGHLVVPAILGSSSTRAQNAATLHLTTIKFNIFPEIIFIVFSVTRQIKCVLIWTNVLLEVTTARKTHNVQILWVHFRVLVSLDSMVMVSTVLRMNAS